MNLYKLDNFPKHIMDKTSKKKLLVCFQASNNNIIFKQENKQSFLYFLKTNKFTLFIIWSSLEYSTICKLLWYNMQNFAVKCANFHSTICKLLRYNKQTFAVQYANFYGKMCKILQYNMQTFTVKCAKFYSTICKLFGKMCKILR